MKTASTSCVHHARLCGKRPGALLVLACVLVMAFSGRLPAGTTTFAHMPGRSGPGGFHSIPMRPYAKALSHAAFRPDLAVEQIRFAQKGRGQAEAVITIKNTGKGTSPATRAAVILIRGDKTKAKGALSVKALKAGEAATRHWRFRSSSGSNTVKVTVNGKSLEKTFFVMAPAAKALAHRKAIQAAGARRVLSTKHPVTRGLLIVQQVVFDDLQAQRPGASRVTLRLKNAGGKATPARTFRIEIKRADGTRGWKSLKVRALGPHESVHLETTLRMTRGMNTLKIPGIGGTATHPATTFNENSRGFVARHVFNPRLFAAVKRNNAALAKNAARANQAKSHGRAVPNPDTFRVLSPGKHVTLPKQVKISTYDVPVTRFLQPERGAVMQPNQRTLIRWAWGNSEPGPDTHLALHLSSITDPKRFPEFVIARDLPSSVRQYPWDMGAVPPGHLYRLQLYAVTGNTKNLLTSREIKIDTPHFGVFRTGTVPRNKIFVHEPMTIYADVINNGGDVSRPFDAKIKIYYLTHRPATPVGFVTESAPIRITALENGHTARISYAFTPPIRGDYRVVCELDTTHRYIMLGDETPESTRSFTFRVREKSAPDLYVTINKVTDGVLAIDPKHFHILVENRGTIDSPPTKVYFDLTDQARKVYDVPSLHPGDTWKHEFTKKWQSYSGGTGRKNYSVAVDPENEIAELDETNNRVSDHFHIYRAGQPMPQHTPIPPTMQVTDVYGLPTEPIPQDYAFHFVMRMKCVSPDRVRCGGWVSTWIDHGRYDMFLIQPPEYLYESWWSGSDRIHADVSTGPHTLYIKVKPWGSDTWTSIYQYGFTVRANDNHQKALSEALAAKDSILSHGGNPLPSGGASGKTVHAVTLLAPAKNKVWAAGRTYQIAWTGNATGPFTVTLIPKDHPDASIQIDNNVPGRSLDWTVGNNLAAGLYRVKVQSADGWGLSDYFAITGNNKPNLTFKAVSLTNKLSGDPQNPYIIEAHVIIENKGGYETKPFTVTLQATQRGVPMVQGGILLDPMLDKQTTTGKIPIKVPRGGIYAIRLFADSFGKVDESNDKDNTFDNRRYRVKSYPDLRIAGRQEGQRLHFTVKNTGDGISGGTTIKLKFKTSTPSAFPGWHRQGEYLVAPPIPVPSLGGGRMIAVEEPRYPFPIHGHVEYIAAVNNNRAFRELCEDNNFVAGALSATSHRSYPDDWWKTAFGVENHVQNDITIMGSSPSPHNRMPISFAFVIWNKGNLSVTPQTDPPLQAVLHLQQGPTDKTFTYDIPPLFFVSSTSRRDEFRIERSVPFLVSRGDVSYTLFLKKGREMVALASGKIRMNLVNGTCTGE